MRRPQGEAGYVVITAVTGTTPGSSAGISYTVDFQGVNGTRVTNVTGIKAPSANRVSTSYDVDAAAVGSFWPAYIIGGRIIALIQEHKADDDCE